MLAYESAIYTYFGKLGFEREIAAIYLSLYANGPQAISALSRSSNVERTRVYRLIDTLLSSNLIEVEASNRRGVIKAAPIANLRITINQREQELKNLTDELELIEQVLARNSLSNHATRIQLYHGQDGLRQLLRNELAAKSEILSYGNRVNEKIVGKKFLDNWQTTRKASSIHERQLTNQTVGDMPHLTKYIRRNFIDNNTLSIANATVIYDNMVTHYHQKDGEVFGTEVYNQEIADMQRQLFEVLWEQSTPAN